MNRTPFAKSVARRSVLSAVGAGLAGLLIRPLQAQEARGAPKRLLIVHRPCGSIHESFFPSGGSAKSFELPEILKPLEPLKNDMVILQGVSNPRDVNWPGDAHAAGLITMLTGKKFIEIPGSNSAGDPNAKDIVASDASIDQYLLAKLPSLRAAVPSIQSTAYLASSSGLPSFKVMSYKGQNQPLFPQHDAAGLFKSLFGGVSAEDLASAEDDKSVLDCVSADLNRLQDLIPASQRSKLDSHLSAIQALEADLASKTSALTCKPPAQTPLPGPTEGVSQGEAEHFVLSQNQLGIIRTAFQCDLTRVATFSFAHGNSDIRFKTLLADVQNADGHHGMSHNYTAQADLARVDRAYCEQLSQCLQLMKATPEGDGSLLDNTVVVFLSECAYGITHDIQNMPLLMLGGKNLGLQTGQHLDFGGRYMNDVWSAMSAAFGYDAPFGDAEFAKDPVSGLFI